MNHAASRSGYLSCCFLNQIIPVNRHGIERSRYIARGCWGDGQMLRPQQPTRQTTTLPWWNESPDHPPLLGRAGPLRPRQPIPDRRRHNPHVTGGRPAAGHERVYLKPGAGAGWPPTATQSALAGGREFTVQELRWTPTAARPKGGEVGGWWGEYRPKTACRPVCEVCTVCALEYMKPAKGRDY